MAQELSVMIFLPMGGATGGGEGTTYPALLRPISCRGYNEIHIRLQHLEQHSTLDSWSVASNLKLHNLDKVLSSVQKNIGGQETSPLTFLFSLSPKYLLVLLTDDDDDDNDDDE